MTPESRYTALQEMKRRSEGRTTHEGLIVLLALEPLEPVSLKHGARGQRTDHQPVERRCDRARDDQEPLSALLACGPVRLNQRGRDQVRVEVEVVEQEGRGREGLEGEVEGREAGLEGAERRAREGLVRLVPGLESVGCAAAR